MKLSGGKVSSSLWNCQIVLRWVLQRHNSSVAEFLQKKKKNHLICEIKSCDHVGGGRRPSVRTFWTSPSRHGVGIHVNLYFTMLGAKWSMFNKNSGSELGFTLKIQNEKQPASGSYLDRSVKGNPASWNQRRWCLRIAFPHFVFLSKAGIKGVQCHH